MKPDHSGYYTPGGFFPSVTTIIKETSSEDEKANLQRWRERMANRYEGDPDGLEKAFQAPLSRGSWVHASVENWLQELPHQPNIAYHGYWRCLKAWLEQNIHSYYAIEKPIWHPLGFSGTFDFCGWTYDSTDLVLLDWKTSKRPRTPPLVHAYKLQCAAYRAGIRNTYGIEVNQASVVIARPFGTSPDVWPVTRRELDVLEDEFVYRLKDYQRLHP
ncbi:MAG: hypothetical protein ACO29V_10790 [Limnohabitans sp.]